MKIPGCSLQHSLFSKYLNVNVFGDKKQIVCIVLSVFCRTHHENHLKANSATKISVTLTPTRRVQDYRFLEQGIYRVAWGIRPSLLCTRRVCVRVLEMSSQRHTMITDQQVFVSKQRQFFRISDFQDSKIPLILLHTQPLLDRQLEAHLHKTYN